MVFAMYSASLLVLLSILLGKSSLPMTDWIHTMESILVSQISIVVLLAFCKS